MKTETMGHAPGPWMVGGGERVAVIGPQKPDQFKTIYPIVARIELDEPALYSHVGKHNGNRQWPTKEKRLEIAANARLIAAAPELLAALQQAAKHISGFDCRADTLSVIRAAISKATTPSA